MKRVTLRAGLTRLRRGLREYFGRGQDESADMGMSQRARTAERWDAAIRRLEAARVLREAGLPHDALILFREAGLLLARATIAATDAASAVISRGDQTTVEKLMQVLERERRPVPVGFARDFSTVILTDSTELDRLSPREATLRAARADSMTRWLADAVEPRSPRQRTAARNLRIAIAVLAVLAIPIAREIWVLSPTNISFHKKVTASTQMPNTNPQGVVDDEFYGPRPFHSAEEASPWLSIDLGKRYVISDAEVFAGNESLPLAFEVSDDGISYKTVATKTEPFAGLLPWVVKPLHVDARFVRLRMQRSGSLSLSEVIVYGRKAAVNPPPQKGIDAARGKANAPTPSSAFTSSPTSTPSPTPTPSPTSTPTPTKPPVTISGSISYCANPFPAPVPNVSLTVTGSVSNPELSNASDNYQLTLASGGTYTVTPTKAVRKPGSAGIDTVDVAATQRHFFKSFLSGCRLTAADVNGDGMINTVDVIAIQRFFLGHTTGLGNTGKYQFTPVNHTYPAIGSNQTGHNYDTLIFGDVVAGFVHRANGESQMVPEISAAIALPEIAVDDSRNIFIAAVTTSTIDAKSKLVAFQGDFTFDERVVTFQSEPVQKAGLTAGNWNVSGNVLPGTGPTRTLRISAFSNDFTPLSGSGTLFELRVIPVSQAAQGSQLFWAAPPGSFIFVDADLNTQRPSNAAPGSVTHVGKRR